MAGSDSKVVENFQKEEFEGGQGEQQVSERSGGGIVTDRKAFD